jgi:hypothetical protein
MTTTSHPFLTNHAFTALLLTTTFGCALDEDVSVGATGDVLNLDQCYSTAAGCKSTPKMLTANAADSSGCSASGSRFTPVELLTPDLCEGDLSCSESLIEAEVSHDGSLWFLGQTMTIEDGADVTILHLGHVTSDGALLGLTDFAPQGYGMTSSSSLVVDAQGMATVAVYLNFAADADAEWVETTTLYTYLPEVTLRGTPVALTGFARPHLAINSGLDYVVAGNALAGEARGVLGRIASNGTLQQSTNHVETRGNKGQGIVALTSHAEAGYSLLAEQPGSNDTHPAFQILRFDHALRATWSLPLPSTLAAGYGASMVSDSEGRLVVGAVLGDSVPSSLGVYGFDQDGAERFSLALDGFNGDPSVPVMTAGESDSRVWVMANDQAPSYREYIAEIDVEAGKCQAHEYTAGGGLGLGGVRDIMVTADGQVFVLTQYSLIRMDEVVAE